MRKALRPQVKRDLLNNRWTFDRRGQLTYWLGNQTRHLDNYASNPADDGELILEYQNSIIILLRLRRFHDHLFGGDNR